MKIISLLPTRIASPSLELISKDYPFHSSAENFVAMANRALLNRNPSHPLLSLLLEVSCCDPYAKAMVSSLLSKARSLDLRHLAMEHFWLSDFLPILPIVFAITSLRCLSLRLLSHYLQELNFPSGINLTCLRSLPLQLIAIDLANLNPFLSELCSLEDLHLDIKGLSLPLLESLHLEIRYDLRNLLHIHAKVPLLRKAVIKLGYICEKNAHTVDGLLNCISHVEELSLHLYESTYKEYPIPILLESGKDMPKFSNLKHLDVTLCFPEHNLAAVIMMLHNCPILKSLKLVKELLQLELQNQPTREQLDRELLEQKE